MKVVDLERLLNELLDELSADWCDVGWAYGLAIEAGLSSDAARDAGLAIIHRGLREGLIVAGDLDAKKFTPWDTQGEGAAARIRRNWWAQGTARPEGASIAWLDITARGEERLAELQG